MASSSSMVPPPLGLGRPSQKSKRYKLVIVQNPVRARCCGFGEKDRRPIDPPPILQLFIERPDGTLQNANEDDSNLNLFVVQCDLVSEDGKEQRSHVFNPSSATSPSATSTSESIPTTGTLLTFNDPAPTRSLMGAVVSNAYQLTDQSNKAGIFFVFQDLSVRIEGRFCLKFMFMNLSAGDPLTMSTQVSDDVLSNPFTVYSAKNFPGMTDSTAISQCFAQQGIKISIRKGRRIRRIVDHTYSNNTVVDTQQKALASSISSSASSSSFNTNKNYHSNSKNHNTNVNHENSSNSNTKDVIVKYQDKNNNEDEADKQDDDEPTPTSTTTATAATAAVATPTPTATPMPTATTSSSTTTTENKPTYRRIDISTFLTPSNP